VLPRPGDPRLPLNDAQSIARAARHALGDIAVQGEGPAAPPESAPAALSHFDRLRAIFDGLRTLGSEPPVRKVPDNPVAGLDLITDRSANLLARAANLRYRVLMLEIAIAVYTRNAQEVDGKNVLQTVTQWAVFDEMLGGIRTTAQKLVTMPRERGGDPATAAAAPLFMPDEQQAPGNQRERWVRLLALWEEFAALLPEAQGAGIDGEVRGLIEGLTRGDDARRSFAQAVRDVTPS
jgi:hypothetical protein